MFSCSNKLEKWFESVAQNNITYILNNISKMAKSVDNRVTKDLVKIYQGFTALHYSIVYNNQLLVHHLLQHEILVPTQNYCKINIKLPGFNSKQPTLLHPRTSALQLAFMLKNTEIAQKIINYISANQSIQKKFFQQLNADKQNNLDILLLCNYQETHNLLVNNKLLIKKELTQSLQNSIIHKMALHKRQYQLLSLYQILNNKNQQIVVSDVDLNQQENYNIQQSVLKDLIYGNLLQLDQQQNSVLFYVNLGYSEISQIIDVNKTDFTEEDMVNTQLIIQKLTKQAYYYIKLCQLECNDQKKNQYYKNLLQQYGLNNQFEAAKGKDV